MKNQVDPNRVIYTIEENFKDELSKPKLRNLILTSIVIGKTDKLRVNEYNIPQKLLSYSVTSKKYVVRLYKLELFPPFLQFLY